MGDTQTAFGGFGTQTALAGAPPAGTATALDGGGCGGTTSCLGNAPSAGKNLENNRRFIRSKSVDALYSPTTQTFPTMVNQSNIQTTSRLEDFVNPQPPPPSYLQANSDLRFNQQFNSIGNTTNQVFTQGQQNQNLQQVCQNTQMTALDGAPPAGTATCLGNDPAGAIAITALGGGGGGTMTALGGAKSAAGDASLDGSSASSTGGPQTSGGDDEDQEENNDESTTASSQIATQTGKIRRRGKASGATKKKRRRE
uniref:Uncharacterized protein n=1 Tax=Meloidogyne enterolobii TaxID=390850 RepID=A0A6V7WD65_MELEN|nr:unnamed protein product [Meloidogyne enterolobii]